MTQAKNFYDFFDPLYEPGKDRMETLILNQSPDDNLAMYEKTLANTSMTSSESSTRLKATAFMADHALMSRQSDYQKQVFQLMQFHIDELKRQIEEGEMRGPVDFEPAPEILRRNEISILHATIITYQLSMNNREIQNQTPAPLNPWAFKSPSLN